MKPAVHKQPKGEPGNPVSNDMQLYRLSGTLKVIIILKFNFTHSIYFLNIILGMNRMVIKKGCQTFK